ncbi:hypothetical protein ACFLZM_00795 [Thermodesulfobacteriota bacterium]
MNFPAFVKGMKRHFKITNDVNRYVDGLLSSFRNKVILDLCGFEDWLKSQIGDYISEDGMCMREAIEKHYGPDASKFIEDTIW